MSIGDLILGVKSVTVSNLNRYDTLLQNVTAVLLQNATEVYYKMPQLFNYKMWQLLQNATFITNCDSTTLKSDAKFEEKLTLGSKNDMRKLVNFNVSSGKSENVSFDVLLLSIAYNVSAKKVQKSYLSWHWRVIQTLKKPWLFLWKWHKEFGEFSHK